MDQSTFFNTQANQTIGLKFPRTAVIGLILSIALVAFEIFNFDTTRYALHDLLGDVNFLGLRWASILAIAFCAIDFAGLARLFTPERGSEEPKAVWYLMGAWLLGATMNALMTWWAVSLTLLTHDFGNEVMSRQQLLQIVPIFVATLVWLTRILFIGAFSVAGEYIFVADAPQPQKAVQPTRPLGTPVRERDTAVPTPTPHTPHTPHQPAPHSPHPAYATRSSQPGPHRYASPQPQSLISSEAASTQTPESASTIRYLQTHKLAYTHLPFPPCFITLV